MPGLLVVTQLLRDSGLADSCGLGQVPLWLLKPGLLQSVVFWDTIRIHTWVISGYSVANELYNRQWLSRFVWSGPATSLAALNNCLFTMLATRATTLWYENAFHSTM